MIDEDINFKITSLFYENSILFLGYSFNDLDIQRLYYKIYTKFNNNALPAFIVLHEDNEYTNSRKNILESIYPNRLKVIKCDTRLFLAYLWYILYRDDNE